MELSLHGISDIIWLKRVKSPSKYEKCNKSKINSFLNFWDCSCGWNENQPTQWYPWSEFKEQLV